MNGTARVDALVLHAGRRAARLECDPALVPPPGRYILAHDGASAALLASPLFLAESTSHGFIAAPPIPQEWSPGSDLNVRGPLGRGFALPPQARRVALACMAADVARLLPLAAQALAQHAAVALVCDAPPEDLPVQLEVQPPQSLRDVWAWSDYAAFDADQEGLQELVNRLGTLRPVGAGPSEILVRAPMPCGGLADCAVCSIRTPGGFRLVCIDGPVFDLELLLGGS